MASLAGKTFELSVLVTANLTEFTRKMGQVSKDIEGYGKAFKDAGKGLSTYVTLPLTALGGVAVASAIKFEKLETSMQILTGSVEEGSAAFQRLAEFSARTPLRLGDLASVNNTLMGFGLSADASYTAIQQLADVSAVAGGDINGMAIAYGQAAAEGRVMTRDLLQFVNNGVPIFRLLTEVTGKSSGELRDMAAEGRISFDILAEAMRRGTEEGGLFFQGTERLAKTLGGQLSTLADSFELLMGSFGDIIGDAIEPFVSILTDAMDALRGMNDSTKRTILIVGGIASAIGPVLAMLGFLATTILPAIGTGFAILTSPITLVVAALAAVAAAALYIWDNWAAVKERISDISWWRNTLLDMVIFLAKYNPMSLLLQGFEGLMDYLGIEFPKMSDMAIGELESMKVETKQYENEFGSFGQAVKNAGREALEGMGLMGKASEDMGDSVDNAGSGLSSFNEQAEITRDVMSEVAEGLAKVKGEAYAASVLGEEFDENAAKADVFRDAIQKLVAQGIDPESAAIQNLAMELRAVHDATSDVERIHGDLANSMSEISAKSQVFGASFDANAARIQATESAINSLIENGLTPADAEVRRLKEQWEELMLTQDSVSNKMEEFAEAVEASINQASIAVVAGISEMAGAMLAGGDASDNLGLRLLGTLGNLMIQVGEMAIAVGIGIEGIKQALQSLNPYAALAAGIALVALGAWVRGRANDMSESMGGSGMPQFANGGIVSGPTIGLMGEYAGATRNPEVIAPLDKLQRMLPDGGSGSVEVYGRISGSDILLSSERSANQRQRRRGF